MMTQKLVAYANMLTVMVVAQAVELENQRRLLDINTELLKKCAETMGELMAELDKKER